MDGPSAVTTTATAVLRPALLQSAAILIVQYAYLFPLFATNKPTEAIMPKPASATQNAANGKSPDETEYQHPPDHLRVSNRTRAWSQNFEKKRYGVITGSGNPCGQTSIRILSFIWTTTMKSNC